MVLLGRFAAGLSSLVSRVRAAVAPTRPTAAAGPTPTPTPTPGTLRPKPPEIFVFAPVDDTGPMVPVRFVVSDPTNARIDVLVEYSFAGGAFQPATPGPTSDRMTDIAAPDLQVDYRFVWNALADVGAVQGAAQIRMTPVRGSVKGQPSVGSCTLDTTAGNPPPPLPAPPPPLGPTIIINAGDNQLGISGRLLPDPLSVQVLDGSGQPVLGAAIAWAVDPAVQADIEPYPYRSTGVDWTGLAFARVRFRPGFVGAGTIRATIVGVPDQYVDFQVEARKPLILGPTYSSPAGEFGEAIDFDIQYDADGNWATYDYADDPAQPVVLRLEATNAVLLQRELRPPLDATVTLVPTIFSGTVTVHITDTADPSVTLDIPVPIDTQTEQRLTGMDKYGPHYSPVQMQLAPRSGLVTRPAVPPNPALQVAQVGYPGLTLATQFQVDVTDGATSYDTEVTSGISGCGVTPTTQGLTVTWACATGTIAYGGRSGTQLDAPVGQPVAYTPSGKGPWLLYASVSAYVLDPQSVPYNWIDPNGNPQCAQEHALLTNVSFAFPIQTPADVQLVYTTSPPGAGTAVATVTPGDQVHVAVKGLSPVSGGTPDDVTLTALDHGGGQPTAYTGTAAPVFEVTAAMHLSGTELDSDDVTPIQAEPRMTIAAGSALSVLPGGLVEIHNDGFDRTIGVHARTFDRFADAPVLQESPGGTSPASGAADSVLLHSGELRYHTLDLDFQTRAGTFQLARTYSSHLRTDGPLGPGWASEHFAFLDVSGIYLRLATGDGRLYELFGDQPSPGVFMSLTRNTAIDPDTSPFELMDAHRNVLHFNWDGSLRFVRDRLGNRTRYTYDAHARLVEIDDPHGRALTLLYWQQGDPVAPQTYGKLRSVTDFAGRVVDFAYYAAPDPGGPPGALKTVSPPAASSPTLVGGQTKNAYRRSETYTYTSSATDALDVRLKQVQDSEGRVFSDTTWTGRQVTSQQHGSASFTFAFDPATRTTTVTDRAGNVSKLVYPASPFPDGAAPEQVTHVANTTLDPNATDRVYGLRHNRDGLRVSLTLPSNAVVEHVYDETNQDPRAQGNLLAVWRRATTGDVRVESTVYESRYNFPQSIVEAAGNAPGSCQRMYERLYWYDYQLGGADLGNAVQIALPRTLNAVIVPLASGSRELRWIDENPTTLLAYNAFGLVTQETDPQGVVTQLAYYPEATPTGGATSAAGGGLLASVTRDAATTTTRDEHLDSVPLDSQTTTWRYDALGNLYEIDDVEGVTTRSESDNLHQVVKVTEAIRVVGGAADPRVTDYVYNEHGTVARVAVEQPGVSAWAGGATGFVEADYDERGNVVARRFKLHSKQGKTPDRILSEQVVRDPGDRPQTVTAADNRTLGTAWDERGLLGRVNEGTAPPASLRRSPDGDVHELDGPAGDVRTAHEDDFGEAEGAVDPLGAVERVHRDDGHNRTRAERSAPAAGRSFPAPAGTATASFSEQRVDELGRLRREHHGVFDPAAASKAAPSTPPEYMGPLPAVWPPPAGLGAFHDGALGPNDGRTTTDFLYDGFGLLTRVVGDELGSAWVRRDAHGRPFEWCYSQDDVSPFFNIVTRTYDTVHRVRETRAADHSTDGSPARTIALREEFDVHGKLERVIDGEGNAFRYEYDHRGLPTIMYDPMAPDGPDTFNGHAVNLDGEETTFDHDGVGRLTHVETKLTKKNPKGIGRVPDSNPYNTGAAVLEHWQYDEVGRLAAVFDMTNRMTQFRYDGAGRLQSVSYQTNLGSPPTTHSLAYANGTIDTATDGNGTRLKFVQDGKGRVTDIHWEAHGAKVAVEPKGYDLHYDDADNLHVARDQTTGRTVTTVYDSASWVRSETQGQWPAVVSELDGAGRLTKLTYPGGAVVEYRWDRTGRLRQVIDGGTTIKLEWLGVGRLASYGDGRITCRYGWSDGAGRLVSMAASGLVGGALAYAVVPDRRGRISAWTRTFGSSSDKAAFTFDSACRLVHEAYDWTPAVPLGSGYSIDHLEQTRVLDGDGVVREWTQDTRGPAARGPITWKTERGDRGRITKVGTTTIAYDANGNLVTDSQGRTYVWDAWNRLVQITHAGQVLVSYRYDHVGRLVSRTDPAGEEDFVYDGWRLIEVRRGGAVVERYVWGLPGQLLAVVVGTARYTVLTRPDGSVDCLVDAHQKIVERYDYTAFGSLVVRDPSGKQLAAPRIRLLFHCTLWDSVAGLHHIGQRWLSPPLEQFLTPDPLGASEGSNHYALCRNDPVNLRDASGLGLVGDVIDYLKEGLPHGGRAAAGAVYGFGRMIGQAVLQLIDLGGAAVSMWPGAKPWRPLSDVGRMADQGMGSGDILAAMGRGIVETPGRMWAAAQRGDSFAAGEEALNFYMLFRPVIRGATSIVLNRGIRCLALGGARGLALRSTIRNWQLRRMILPEVERMLGRRMPRNLVVEYGGDQGPGSYGMWVDRLTTARIYEAAFTPGLTDYWYMLRAAAGRPLTMTGVRYRLSTRLGRLRLWKGGASPIESTLHEVWHGVQAEAMPEEYNEVFTDLRNFPDQGTNPLEFSEMDSPMNPTDLAGAHDFGVDAKPPNALSPAALAAHLPIVFASGQIYRR